MSDNQDLENTIIIELKDGPVHITLLPDVAPLHCARMKELARSGQYDNVCFHRVIDGFMAQTGDVQNGDMEDGFNLGSAGTGGLVYQICLLNFQSFHMTVEQLVQLDQQVLTQQTLNFS